MNIDVPQIYLSTCYGYILAVGPSIGTEVGIRRTWELAQPLLNLLWNFSAAVIGLTDSSRTDLIDLDAGGPTARPDHGNAVKPSWAIPRLPPQL